MENFGRAIFTTPVQDTLHSFLDELDNEHIMFQIYLHDMDKFIRNKLKKIQEEVRIEDKFVKLSILSQPHYKIYDGIFNDLVSKNLFTAVISKLEINVLELIVKLEHENVIKSEFKIPRNKIIINSILFLETELKLKNLRIENIELFINLRNSIIHNDSILSGRITSNPHFQRMKTLITVEKGKFYLADLKLNLFLLKEIKTFFSSVSAQTT